MSVVDGGSGSGGLVARVQGILLRPQDEWAKIDTETATVQGLFTGYAMILAAIPAVGGLIGQFLVLHNIVAAVVWALVQYGLGLVGVYIFGFIIDALAPSFSSTKDQMQAMKVAVYAPTAGWVAGIFNAIPVIGGLIALLGGLYSLYLLYLGLPKLMKTPADKGIVYLIVAIVIYALIFFLIAMVATMVVGVVVGGAMVAAGAAGALR